LQALPAADWSVNPSYSNATRGIAADGGDITSDVDTGLVGNYSLDVTTTVQPWVGGSSTNQGILLQLGSQTVDNGLGIQLTSDSASYLEVNKIPLILVNSQLLSQQNDTGQLSLTFQVVPDTIYYLLKNITLGTAGWAIHEDQSSESPDRP
jgi:hypothetical protein